MPDRFFHGCPSSTVDFFSSCRCCWQSAVCILELGCCCPLQGCCYRAPLQGAAAVVSFARCCAGSMLSGLEGPCKTGSPLSLVLASFWLRFSFAYARVAVVLAAAQAAQDAKAAPKEQAAAPAEPAANLHRFCCRSSSCRLRPALRPNCWGKSILWLRVRAMLCRFLQVLSEENARSVFPAMSVILLELRNSSAPAMNPCTKQCSWCDFSGAMCPVFFAAACHTRCAFSGVMWDNSTPCSWNMPLAISYVGLSDHNFGQSRPEMLRTSLNLGTIVESHSGDQDHVDLPGDSKGTPTVIRRQDQLWGGVWTG